MSKQSKKTMTVHKSFLFRNITVAAVPTIHTHNIAKGLTIEKLEAAVAQLVDRNPILSGVLKYGNQQTGPGVFVETCHYDTFVHRVDIPKHHDIPSPVNYSGDVSKLMEYVQKNIEPLIPPTNKGTEELSKKLPLFGIHFIELPDGYVYYAPRLSHVIGDGTTYFMLLEELNAILNSIKLPPPIVWESEGGIVFDFTHQIKSFLFWIAMIMIVIVYAIRGFPPTSNIVLCKYKIAAKKKQLAEEGSYLSTNDIVTAAICESVGSEYNYFSQAVCYRRGRWPGVGERDGGNITRLLPFTTELGKDPNQVRKLVDSVERNPCRDIPFWDTVIGSGYNQTNWANIQQSLQGTIFQTPSQKFLDEVDIPQVLIHQPNDAQIVIMHKLRNVDPTVGLLSELTVGVDDGCAV